MVQAQRRLTRQRPGTGGGASRRRAARRLRRCLLLIFLLPALALYTMFIVYPLGSSLQYSLFRWSGTTAGRLRRPGATSATC